MWRTLGVMRRGPAVVLSVLGIAIAGCGSEDKGSGGVGDPVAEYCAYGAVSDAQLAGCEDHVDESDIAGLDTNAAKYSRGELDGCLGDAGPYCEER